MYIWGYWRPRGAAWKIACSRLFHVVSQLFPISFFSPEQFILTWCYIGKSGKIRLLWLGSFLFVNVGRSARLATSSIPDYILGCSNEHGKICCLLQENWFAADNPCHAWASDYSKVVIATINLRCRKIRVSGFSRWVGKMSENNVIFVKWNKTNCSEQSCPKSW